MHGDENDAGLTDFSALNLVREYDVWSHYFESEDSILKEYRKKYDLKKVVAIPEDAGLYVTEKFIEAVGPSAIKVFDGELSRILQPRQKI